MKWCLLLVLGAQENREYKFKAAYLYQFAQFVEWPDKAFADGKTPIRIGVLGKDPFGDILDKTVEGKVVRGRSFEVVRYATLKDVKDCHLLFLAGSEKDEARKHAQALKELPTLTVGELDGFCKGGGIVNFYVDDNRLRFEINPDAANRAGLKVSSKLLNLARIVKE